MIGWARSLGGTPVTGMSSSIGSSTNSSAFRLDPRGLLPLVAVLLLEEPPLGGVRESKPGTDAAGEDRRTGWSPLERDQRGEVS